MRFLTAALNLCLLAILGTSSPTAHASPVPASSEEALYQVIMGQGGNPPNDEQSAKAA